MQGDTDRTAISLHGQEDRKEANSGLTRPPYPHPRDFGARALTP